MPIYEPGLDEVLERCRDRISFTLDVREAVDGADFLYVAVGTPPTYSGDADLSAVWSVVDELPDDVSGRPLLVMKSTVPVGTGEHVRARLDARGLESVGYVSNPEFRPRAAAVADFMQPRPRRHRRVRRRGRRSRRRAPRRRSTREFVRTDVASAELVKLAANAFLSTRISFINEIANVCELVGADVVDVARGVGLDHRLGPHFLRAGIGFGGSCFPKDVTALKQLAGNSGYPLPAAAGGVGGERAAEAARRAEAAAASRQRCAARTIALLGLAFKPNTDDMREAPSRVIAYRLLAEGAEVRGVGSGRAAGRPAGRRRSATPSLEAVRDADAAVIVTEWPELHAMLPTPEMRDAMARPLIIDGRNLLDPVAVRGGGLRLRGDRPPPTRRHRPSRRPSRDRETSA